MQLTKNPVPERRRQSFMALLFIVGTFIRRIALRAWPLLLIYLRPNADGRHTSLLLLILGITTFSLISGILNYYRFYFWLDEDNIYVEQGVLKKSRISVPLDRIQSINTEQNLIYRLFNIVRIELDTAGAKGSEVKIYAVSRELATQIHDFVMENKKAVSIEIDEETETSEERPVQAKWRTILQLGVGDLLKIGLAQNHLRAIFIIIAFLFARFEDARELMGENVVEKIDAISESGWFSDVLLISFLVGFGIAVSILVSLITVVTRFFGFQLMESAKGMKTEHGLFTKRQRNLSFKRTQIFQYTVGPIRKLVGLYNVKVFQAAAEGPSGRDAVQIPGCPADQIESIKAKFFENKVTVDELTYRINSIYVFRKWLFQGLLLGLILSGVFIYLNYNWYLALSLGYMAYSLFKNYSFYHSFRFGFSEDLLSVRSGFWILKYRTLQLYKVQAVEIGQGIYQRSKGYADLVLYTAGGAVTIPYINLEEARMLQNYILYKVESSGEKWM